MSLPLHDIGSVKISERAQSYLAARADQQKSTIVALIRDLVESHVSSELHVFSMADQKHIAKQLGKITGDTQ
jgi:hypothetical protein